MKEESNRSFDLNELKEVSHGDKQFIEQMIGVFIKINQEGMDEIELAFKEKNYKTISECIHKLVPPCRHMGAVKLVNTLTDIKQNIANSEPPDKIETLIAQAKQEINTVSEELKEELNNKNIF